MSENITLNSLISGIKGIEGLFLTAMPDCLLYDSWVSKEKSWSAEEVAVYFGDLIRSNREGLKALNAYSADMQVTIESSDLMVVLKEVRGDFVIGFVFDKSMPLGMIRLQVDKIVSRIMPTLPVIEVEKRSQGAKIMEYLNRYSPDSHAVINRLVLQTGLSKEKLTNPDLIDEHELKKLENAAMTILGVKELRL
jgi:predicted regulator of Ras-like GTPase activity (Roadblock/LC7/MglB family)